MEPDSLQRLTGFFVHEYYFNISSRYIFIMIYLGAESTRYQH